MCASWLSQDVAEQHRRDLRDAADARRRGKAVPRPARHGGFRQLLAGWAASGGRLRALPHLALPRR